MLMPPKGTYARVELSLLLDNDFMHGARDLAEAIYTASRVTAYEKEKGLRKSARNTDN